MYITQIAPTTHTGRNLKCLHTTSFRDREGDMGWHRETDHSNMQDDPE